MARQTAFPGVLVESIKVEKPPFDEPGVVQEFVGRGATKEFEELVRDITPEQIRETFEGFEEMIGPLRDTFKVRYNLLVKTAPLPNFKESGGILEGGEGLGLMRLESAQERSVSVRARAFTRVKNPFEPDVLEVGEPSIDETLTKKGSFNVYRVPVWVTK